MSDTYRIYTRWLAVELRRHGFQIVGTDINKYHPEFTIWIFKDSIELQHAISEITKNHKNRR